MFEGVNTRADLLSAPTPTVIFIILGTVSGGGWTGLPVVSTGPPDVSTGLAAKRRIAKKKLENHKAMNKLLKETYSHS